MTPLVLQSVLRRSGARTHLHRFYRAEHVRDFFAREGVPDEAGPTILCAHAEQKDGDVTSPCGWEDHGPKISKDTIPDLLTNAGGTLIAMGCGAVREPLASAFLKAGYEGYVGATEENIDGDPAFIFTPNLFYHLMASERDFHWKNHTVAGAVERAAPTDPGFAGGTRPYRYGSRRDFGLPPARKRITAYR